MDQSLRDLGLRYNVDGALAADNMPLSQLGALASSAAQPQQAPLQSLGQKLLQTWPARLAMGIYEAAKLPGDVAQGKVSMWGDDGRTNPEVINRSADLAGMVMGGTYSGAPSGAVGAGFVRRTKGSSPDNGTGHMMFVTDRRIHDIEGYGQNLWKFESNDVPHGQVVNADDPWFRRALYKSLRKNEDKATARSLVDEANPSRIVDSAGLWDNLDLTSRAWDDVLDPKGIRAVLTEDGAIVFDPSFVKRGISE